MSTVSIILSGSHNRPVNIWPLHNNQDDKNPHRVSQFLCFSSPSSKSPPKMKSPFLFLCVSSFLLLSSAAMAKPFTCNSPPNATCQGLAEYIPANSTNLDSLKSLFQVPSLLTANNVSLSTPATQVIPANSTVRIPFPCRCSNGNGTSDRTPIYTVKASDTGLDFIARTIFDFLVTYEDIAAANGIKNVNVITKGEKLWIPLPCSCDPVNGEKVVHLAHIVAAGSSVAGIAKQFGTEESVLLNLNGISDPKKLQAGQVLDVPLKVGAGVPAPAPSSGNSPPGGHSAGGLRLLGHQVELLVLLQIALFWFSVWA